MDGNGYPVKFFVAYKERQGRLSTFFRLVLAVPWLVWLYVWGIAFTIVVVMAWFVLLFTAQWPAELFNFAVRYMRFQARVGAWLFMLTDKFPAWGGKPDPQFGVTFEVDAQQCYSRPKTFFRLVLVLPLSALMYGVQFYSLIFLFLAWWAILFTGRLPHWCYQPLADSMAWNQRVQGYSNLLVEKWPPFAGNTPLPGVPTEVAA